ncbi:hypothetical protein RUM44_001314 [Polyplax serrata]|uniref:Uncharacterized protein n=1 Tax=Polyplax serrata TaxID=468196 RepID=A0ABR1AJP7_POLSC
MAPTDFQTNKPYRLALYARPSDRRRFNATTLRAENSKLCTTRKNESNISSISNISSKSKTKNQTKNTRCKRVNNVMLFDENTRPDNEKKVHEETPEKTQMDISSILRTPNSRKKVLTDVNSKVLTKTKQVKIRKSYERKCKGKSTEIVVPEQPSNEIIKEMEIKKLSRTKTKKVTAEEQEFEKWASNINSDFNDIDKFELSIAFD